MSHHPNSACIEKNWSIGRIASVRRFKNGVINKTYKVRATNGEYVLRIYTAKSARDVAFEVALLKHIKNLPVPHVVRGNDGDIVPVNSSPAILYKFLEGAQLRKPNEKQREATGAFLAQFHKKGASFFCKKRRFALYSFSKEKKNMFEREVKKSFSGALLDRFFSIARDVSRFEPPQSVFPRGPIHVDVKPENVLFRSGKLSGVIDFDNAYIGPFLLDLAKSMVWFGLGRKRFNLKRALNVYTGYIKTRKLTLGEREGFYKMLRFAFASHLYVDYYMKATGKIPASYFNFLMNDFYNSYISFSRLSEQEFYAYLAHKK